MTATEAKGRRLGHPAHVYTQKYISDNIDDQTQSAGICSHQEELDTEDQTSHQLAQKQGTVGPDLIGDDEKRYADKTDRLYE